jgi:copper chaperone CopZ
MSTNAPAATLALRVPGMTCRHCVRDVTRLLRDVPGVETVAADPAAALVVVGGTMALADVVGALAAGGYAATPDRAPPP